MKQYATIYPVPGPWNGELAIVARPRGGDWLEDEVQGWVAAGLDVIVSLLEKHEVQELGLENERAACTAKDLGFIDFPIPDRGVPLTQANAATLLERLEAAIKAGQSIGVHCRQGIGRSALIASCLLVLSGIEPDSAFRQVGEARGLAVPETPEQREWVIRFASEMAGLMHS